VKTAAAFPDAADVKNAPDIHSGAAALPNETEIMQNLNSSWLKRLMHWG
jgi:hypothetical protein